MSFERRLEREHQHWLSRFDARHLDNWKGVRNGNPEAALFEAAVRDVLEGYELDVQPAADVAGSGAKGAVQRPDFLCRRGGESFYAEAANISIAQATKVTGLPYERTESGAIGYDLLYRDVFKAAQGKTTQCAQDLPTLIAVGAFHKEAAYRSIGRLCAPHLLTGEFKIAWDVDLKTGESPGDSYLSTAGEFAPFLRRNSVSIAGARTSISGILLCGFTWGFTSLIGILHPNADRPFNPIWLPKIVFGEVRIDYQNRCLRAIWPDEPAETPVDDSDLADIEIPPKPQLIIP